jgi:hypothetical protein
MFRTHHEQKISQKKKSIWIILKNINQNENEKESERANYY